MYRDVKEKLVGALRSGEYNQTKGALHRVEAVYGGVYGGVPAGYCCLGVLCDISGLAEWRERDDVPGACFYDGRVHELPETVRTWAGMRSNNGVYVDGRMGNLAEANDAGRSFDEIADIIEEHWEAM